MYHKTSRSIVMLYLEKVIGYTDSYFDFKERDRAYFQIKEEHRNPEIIDLCHRQWWYVTDLWVVYGIDESDYDTYFHGTPDNPVFEISIFKYYYKAENV